MSPSHPNHDQLFKELLTLFLPEFLLLVAPRQAHRLKLEHGRFLDGETFTDFPEGAYRRADLVYATETLEGRPEYVMIHIEVEARFRGDFDLRMARYGLSLFLRHNIAVLPVAVFLRGGGDPGQREIYPRLVELDAAGFWFNRYRYLAVALSQGDAEHYLRKRNPLAAALAALMRFPQGSPAEHKIECLRRIATARELNPVRAFQLANIVDTYIPLDMEEEEKFRRLTIDNPEKEVILMETALDRAVAERVKANQDSWLQEGQTTGLLLGMQRVLLRLLERRFGALPQGVVEEIEGCDDPEQLQRWSEGVLTAPDPGAMGLAWSTMTPEESGS